MILGFDYNRIDIVLIVILVIAWKKDKKKPRHWDNIDVWWWYWYSTGYDWQFS